MATDSRRNDMIGIIGVMILLVGTATGNASVMLGLSLTAIVILTVFYRRQLGSGALLVAFVAAITAGIVSFVVAGRR